MSMELRSISILFSHPEMILGEMKEVSGPYGMETTCAPMEGADLGITVTRSCETTLREAWYRQ